ncbi:copper transport protein ATOX1-like [Anneissia japonica]|uniref:copper transport protein ATOX1-like n=1 Tax=Anneissia japonica TaxID=1529436 RepID=UPI0014256DD6|nr:copper transport protein ATOX1-like [Anneissia japonica]
MSNRYEFNVEMTCGGCSGAVERVLNKKEGIAKFEVDLEKKKVFVETDLSSDEVLEVIKKTGKATTYVGTA